ncbi:MAG: galactokinase family protein, partial [Rikenellaceae bacterium]
MQTKVKAAFASRFEGQGTQYASSGRINLIGEHTDYNEGFVFPGAIEQGIVA